MSQIYFQHTTPSHIKFAVSYALFVSMKLNFRNSVSSFSNVWQPSGKLVKQKLIPVNKEIAFTRRKVFSFPLLIKHIFPSLCPKIVEKQRRSAGESHLHFKYFFPSNFSIISLYVFLSSSYFLDL